MTCRRRILSRWRDRHDKVRRPAVWEARRAPQRCLPRHLAVGPPGVARSVGSPDRRGLFSLSWADRSFLALDDALQHAGRAHAVGPAGIERQVQEGLLQLFIGDAVLTGVGEVELQLIGLTHHGQRRDGDQAAVALGQALALPYLVEEDPVGVVNHSGGEVPEGVLPAAPAGALLAAAHDRSSRSRICDFVHGSADALCEGVSNEGCTGGDSLTGGGRINVVAMDNRNEAREFLMSRRANISPEDAGLAVSGHRRVAGLRRSEVAMLAAVSPEYYAKIERGNLAGVSEAVLEAVARALQLDDAEREHLFDLARSANGAAQPVRKRRSKKWFARESLIRALDVVAYGPAFVRNGRMDVLATNALGRAFYDEVLDGPGKGIWPGTVSSTNGRRRSTPPGRWPRTSPCRSCEP